MTEDIRTRLTELIQEAEDAVSVGYRRHRPVQNAPPKAPAPSDSGATLHGPQSQPQSIEERQTALSELEQEVLVCTRCPLNEGRSNAVPGMGVLDPLVMVIGEGPGAQEDEQGKPFVGRAGQYLDKWLAAIDLFRDTNG
ncbi:MAG: uracil-DNA glycosylase, partial [Spirochaetes bacterium]|nr:uracil-DNA glycosylase [Spirochaetota bacterium]